MPSLLDILGGASDAMLGTVPSIYGGLLSEEELGQAKKRAQREALNKMASAFYAAGAPSATPKGGTGQAIMQALSAGRTGFDEGLKTQLSEKMNMQKLQQAMQSQKRAAEAQKIAQGIFTPATPAQPAPYLAGAPYGKATPAQPGGINQQAIQQLMTTPEGRSALQEIMGARKAMQPEMFSLKEGDIQYSIDPFSNAVTQVATGAPTVVKPELSASFAGAVDALGLPRKNASQYTEAERSLINKKMSDLSKPLVNVNTGKTDFASALDLRSQWKNEPVYKAQQEMQSAYSQIAQGLNAKTPIGDMAAATKIMKLLDPGSVVRESELGMAMAATGLLDRVTDYSNKIINGTKLSEPQRREFQDLANRLYQTSVSAFNEKRNEYVGMAQRYKINEDDVVGKPASIPAIRRIGW